MFRKNKVNVDTKKDNHNEININTSSGEHEHTSIFIKIYEELVKINTSLARQHNKISDHEKRITKLEKNGGRG